MHRTPDYNPPRNRPISYLSTNNSLPQHFPHSSSQLKKSSNSRFTNPHINMPRGRNTNHIELNPVRNRRNQSTENYIQPTNNYQELQERYFINNDHISHTRNHDSGNRPTMVNRTNSEELFQGSNVPSYFDEDVFIAPNRITSIHRNASNAANWQRTSVRPRQAQHSRDFLENHANKIVSTMEQDSSLMEDSPSSEQLRREALRDMPQCLTIKRHIKQKLSMSVSKKGQRKPIGCWKQLKYKWSIQWSKFKMSLRNLAYTFELWYGPLKEIQGHFGSGVASHFRFLRWMFLLNVFITIVALAFIVVPQALYSSYKNSTNNTDFSFENIFTGEGYFENTLLFYGSYSSVSFSLLGNSLEYSMPHAYFFTMLILYLITFIILSIRVGTSYRHNFIETKGGLKNVFAQKLFCGWDYSIATNEAATLKSAALYNELKELLGDFNLMKTNRKFKAKYFHYGNQFAANILVLGILAVTGFGIWKLLLLEQTDSTFKSKTYLSALIINIIMMIYPLLFSYLIKYEDYKKAITSLGITLFRTFLLGAMIVGILISFWLLEKGTSESWETSLGKEMYRLIIFDFIFSILLTSLFEVCGLCLYKYIKKGVGLEFDISRNTLQIIYNQTLFWVGLFFSPLLPVVIVIKLFLTWYIRQVIVLKLCTPSAKSWRAAQTETWFLIMTFLSCFCIIFVLGYIIVNVQTSNNGPFNSYTYIYQLVTKGILQLEDHNTALKIIMYITKPGVIAFIMIGLCVRVYYLRAKCLAQIDLVDILRGLVAWESKDKEFLLQQISQLTKGRWQYNLADSRSDEPKEIVPYPGDFTQNQENIHTAYDRDFQTQPVDRYRTSESSISDFSIHSSSGPFQEGGHDFVYSGYKQSYEK